MCWFVLMPPYFGVYATAILGSNGEFSNNREPLHLYPSLPCGNTYVCGREIRFLTRTTAKTEEGQLYNSLRT